VSEETHDTPESDAAKTAEPESAAATKTPPKSWFATKFDQDLDKLRARLVKPHGPCDPDEAVVVPWGPKQVEGFVDVPAAKILDVCRVLRDDPELRFEILMCISGVDYSKDDERVAVLYHVLSVSRNMRAQIRAWIPKKDCVLDTVESIWPAANWHERETYDLMGVVFRNHSDLRRILCPEDWVGFPLRKDYEFPKEYHGISCV
jgi:NADH-quinone oxidoreductase subunit C